MNIKVIIVVLAVACAGLAIALFAVKKQASDQHASDVTSITEFSNQVVEANEHLKEAGQVNLTLSNSLAASEQQVAMDADQLAQLSNHLAAANATITATKSSLAQASHDLASAEEMVTNLNNRIAELEEQNKFLDQQAETLSNTLTHLTMQIADTKTKLAVSETNAAFLQSELQKQLAQKAELEHKFNDVDALRAQVKRLKEEMFIARRIEVMKNDTGIKKGGELLMMRTTATTGASAHRPATPVYDLNVEIGSDGSVKVIQPSTSTNNPSH